ncbi:MAG: molybdopterin molybdotransferase [Paracoccaceae bacterium]
MISVDEALDHVLSLVAPVGVEQVALAQSAGRVLAADVVARRAQPPFPASAMDGYAVRSRDAHPAATLRVVGQSAAGHRYQGTLSPGEAVRIFTGAPVPEGADRVIIQEDVERMGDAITLRPQLDDATYIRPAGGDFAVGDTLNAPRLLSANDLSLIAAMNTPHVTVSRRPEVAILATGDELVMPSDTPGPDQIIASNSFALKALFEAEGARVRLLPIARDTKASLLSGFEMARGADLLITTGGASVGDHDLVAAVADSLGMQRAFYKIAMRPGKPLMAGRVLDMAMIGLPGNPVSSIVCAHLFVRPAIRAMLGLTPTALPPQTARLAVDLGPNGPRAHYMRAQLEGGWITPFERQDSSLLSVLARANSLMIRPARQGALEKGSIVSFLPF